MQSAGKSRNIVATKQSTVTPMSEKFLAWQIDKDGDQHRFEQQRIDDSDLMDGDVTVRVEYTTLNYKDGLAITGRMPIVRHYPLIPGIDFSGTVIESSHPDFKTGDGVILNGFGVGEGHHGGYAQKARVKGDWLVPLPEGIDARRAMAICWSPARPAASAALPSRC